jgi:hypothetical protein
MLLNKFNKKRLSLIVFILALIMFIGSAFIFYYAMSEFTNTTVGSFFGNGNLDIAIPGEKTYVTMTCNWYPSTGFYLILISTVILTINFLFYIRMILFKKFRNE